MQKETHSNWQKHFICAAIVSLVFMFAMQTEVAGQMEIQYNALYECPRFPHNFKVLSSPNEKNYLVLHVNLYTPSASFQDEILKTHIFDAIQPGDCKLNGKPIEALNPDARQTPDTKNNQKPAEQNKTAQTGRFKVAERVKACAMQMENYPACWENSTIVRDMMAEEGADSYQVLIDDPKGGKGTLAYVPTKFIRAGAPPPPATPDCPFNEPPGTVSKTSKPSAELFKRVIFERYRDNANGRKVGITYQTFELGKSYVNRLTNKGLLNDGAPQGATIYSVKTKYLFCDKHTDSTIRWLVESQFACFKDKFGDWICPVDSVPKYLEQIYLPNK